MRPVLFCALTVMAPGVAISRNVANAKATQMLKAAVVLTPDFCKTRIAIGSRFSTLKFRKESFEVGEPACLHVERSLQPVFASLARLDAEQVSGTVPAQIVLIPKFVDLNATRPSGPAPAFSDRELIVLLEWTAKDPSGNTVWVETVQGSAVRKLGVPFSKQRDRMVEAAVRDLLLRSAMKMSNSPELKRLAP